MSVLAAKSPPRRRGACPGLSSPMPTGDGLLARLMPVGTIPLDAFAALCAAARRCGNGVVEITARGSIQVRGLNAGSATRFGAMIATLGIAADGIPVLTNPLSGIDPAEIFDAGAVAADLRRLATRSLPARLAPKISVVIDGGGALRLEAISADVRLEAETNDGASLKIAVGGNGASAVPLGTVRASQAAEAAARLLEIVAQRGRAARARDVLQADGIVAFRTAVADLLMACTPPSFDNDGSLIGPRNEAIGPHPLRDGSLACGIGLAFGHADVAALEQLAQAARLAGAIGMRAAPDRVLLAIGIRPADVKTFTAAAGRLGLIVRADDPRRRVVACPGAPTCASAYIAARSIAPSIAAIAAPSLHGAATIHISGCAKGCAHPQPAALTVVGRPDGCALIAPGTTAGAPFAVVPPEQLSAAIARTMREGRHV